MKEAQTEIKLNENDKKLLAHCHDRKRSVNEIARFLNIAPSSVITKINKLSLANLVQIEKHGQGKKTFVRTREADKTKNFMKEVLKVLAKNKEMKSIDFHRIFPFDPNDSNNLDKQNAVSMVEFHTPILLEHFVRITPEGLKFLKDN